MAAYVALPDDLGVRPPSAWRSTRLGAFLLIGAWLAGSFLHSVHNFWQTVSPKLGMAETIKVDRTLLVTEFPLPELHLFDMPSAIFLPKLAAQDLKELPSVLQTSSGKASFSSAVVYGVAQRQWGQRVLSTATGREGDKVQGELLTFPQPISHNQLKKADKLLLFNRGGGTQGRRGVVSAVTGEGQTVRAVWFYDWLPPPLAVAQPGWLDQDGDKPWEKSLRLPSSIKPVDYDLSLYVDLTSFKFNGSVDITMTVVEATAFIVLHLKNLNLTSTPLLQRVPALDMTEEEKTQAKRKVPAEWFLYEPHDFLILRFGAQLTPGMTLSLHLAFCGELTDGLAGFYRSQYGKQGTSRWIATTQFEPTDARRAFPCFDEPALKATFRVHFDVPSGYHVLSNMPAMSVQKGTAGRMRFQFQRSVKMSTYLVAFVVSDFKSLETTYKSTDGTTKQVRVWAPAGKEQYGDLALSIAKKLLRYYEDFFGIAFPLPKQDMVAIPDFAAGAMENWGLVTYREASLLFDPKQQSARDRQRVAIVVAHELAHQWFGNLVTMDWWDGLWLNEGFASWMEYEGTAYAFEEWNMRAQFFDQTLAPALAFDGTSETHPILQEVQNPDQISELFDAVSYRKGASLVRMMEGFMGRKTFLTGLSNYLKRFAYGNAKTEDLWYEMDKAMAIANRNKTINVTQVMDGWARQAGFPSLEIARTTEKAGRFTLQQSRYFDRINLPKAALKTTAQWDIPVVVRTVNGSKNQVIWFRRDRSSMPIDLPTDRLWKLNADGFAFMHVLYPPAFMHVLYPPDIRENLTRAFIQRSDVFSQVDRASLVCDFFAFLEAGKLSVKETLSFLQALRKEPSESTTVWTVLLTRLSLLEARVRADATVAQLFAQWSSDLIADAVNQVGWLAQKDESHLKQLSRGALKNAAVTFGIDSEVAEALRLFDKLADPKSSYSVEPDIRLAVYEAGLRCRGELAFRFLWKRAQDESNSAERARILQGLAQSSGADLFPQFLQYTITPPSGPQPGMRTQDSIIALIQASRNKNAQKVFWPFLQENWAAIFRLHGHSSAFAVLIESALSIFDQPDQLKEAKKFFNGRDMGSGNRALSRGYARIQANIDWKERYWKDLQSFLREHESSSSKHLRVGGEPTWPHV
eukprot:g3466.t1